MFLHNLRQRGFSHGIKMAPPRSSARFIARMIKGAKPVPMPGFIEPALATRRDEAPVGDKWVHEVKYDGWRVQAHLDGDEVTLFTRRGHNWTRQFYTVAADVARLPANKLILDGEVVATDAKGMPSYGALIEDLKPDQTRRLAYFVFDLLYMDGFDLRRASLIERKRVLEMLMKEAKPSRIRYSEHIEGDSAAIYKNACRLKLEGIISKRKDSPYRSGRVGAWEKIKCTRRDEFSIIGFIPASGGLIAALYLGRREKRALLYAGKVGTGFTQDQSRMMRQKLEKLVTNHPAIPKLKKPKARWVKPLFLAEVEYLEISRDGSLRHAVLRGFRSARKRKATVG
jgi:bifunctional non-homologous end joining protein LigD